MILINKMGSKQSYPVKIFIFGNKNNIIETIFPDKLMVKDKNSKWENRQYKKELKFEEKETGSMIEEKIEWKATIYPDIEDDNIEESFTSLSENLNIPDEFNELKLENHNDEDSRKRSRNIIIKFGKKNSHYLINYMNDISKTYLPQIAIITSEEFDENKEGLDDNRYLTIIKDNKTDQELKNDIIDYLWSKECYYNERGNASLSKPSIKNDQIITNNFINIMITGISRSGKSTLINILSQKLVTLESPFLESVTNIIREYEIIASKNGIFQSGIRLFDTPGLTKIEKSGKDTIKQVKKCMEKKINECTDARDDIHLIYFVLKHSSNLENYVDFFNFIIDLNKKRKSKEKKKIRVIFIINQSSGKTSEDSLKEFLRTNNLFELYENFTTLNEKSKPLSFKERFGQKVVKEKSEMKNNIISVNLLKTKSNSNAYGIDILLKTTLYFLKKDNPLTEENFEKCLEIKNCLEKVNSNNKENELTRKELEDKADRYFHKIANENSLLSSCENILDILKKAKYEANLCIRNEKFFLFFLFIVLDNISRIERYISLFKKIENCYKIFTDEISIFPLTSENKKKIIFEGFEIFDHLKEKTDIQTIQSKEEKKNLLLKEKDTSKIEHNKIIKIFVNGKKINEKEDKYFLWFGDPILHYFMNYLIDFFENYIRKQCCIDYILNQKKIYTNIFEQIEEMSNNKDWDKFHIQII